MAKIKICGLHSPEDIVAANEAMPDFVGFVFAKSKRQVTLERVKALKALLNPGILSVGVFVDESFDVILEASPVIDMVQLHGRESDGYIRALKSAINKPIIKSIGVRSGEDIKNAEKTTADYLLFDNILAGSGQSFDWSLIHDIKKPFFLAGGINLDNIHDALKINSYALDVSSGAETNGVKDKDKILKLVRSVRNG